MKNARKAMTKMEKTPHATMETTRPASELVLRPIDQCCIVRGYCAIFCARWVKISSIDAIGVGQRVGQSGSYAFAAMPIGVSGGIA